MKKLALLTSVFLFFTNLVQAETSTMSGIVQSKCSIWTEVNGVYGNSLSTKLDTLPASGGVKGNVRLDVLQAASYKAKFTAPVAWSSSPSLSDSGTFVNSVVVGVVSVAAMSAYEAAKSTYNNVTEFNLTLAGSTNFVLNSAYNYVKALPAGTYSSVWTVECIAI